MVPVTCPLCTLPQRVTVHSVVSVFLRHSRTEAVAHCTHTSAYQHTVVPDIETLYFWAVADVAWGEERAPGWRTIPLYAGDLCSCKGHPNFHTFLLFRPKNALSWGLVLCSRSQKHLHPPLLLQLEVSPDIVTHQLEWEKITAQLREMAVASWLSLFSLYLTVPALVLGFQ